VKAGQVLAELAEQDLQLERSKWASELAQHENAYAPRWPGPTAPSW
jgi:hypothetical protein